MEAPIDRYIREHSSAQSEALSWLEKQTNIRTNYPRMLSGAVQGRFLTMLAQLIGAKKVLEIGTFTGYSAICLAYGLPEDGHIDTLEINDELEDLIREAWDRAGMADRITLHIGDARETLAALASVIPSSDADPDGMSPEDPCHPRQRMWGDPSGWGPKDGQQGSCHPAQLGAGQPYDLVYIDANKREYCEYFELVLPMVRPGGLILADDVLLGGKVYDEKPSCDKQTQGLLAFNDMIAKDPRVEVVILPIRDGLSLIRKK